MTELTASESSQLLTPSLAMEEPGQARESDGASEILETRSQCCSETASTAISAARGETGGAGGGGGGGGGGGRGGRGRGQGISAGARVYQVPGFRF